MAKLSQPLVLASRSPRRREILETLGIPFDICAADVDESHFAEERPAVYCERVACSKVTSVLERRSFSAVAVLGADTTVVCDDLMFGKPVDSEENGRMLRTLSDRAHEVMTAIALGKTGSDHLETVSARTTVVFRAISDSEIARYCETGEGLDKAGGYAVQGIASGFVRSIDGSYSNVVGLPASEALDVLRRCDVLASWP